jgi:hypothetical protein
MNSNIRCLKLLRRPGCEAGPVHVRFVVDEMSLERFFSEYFGFPCQYHFTLSTQVSTSTGNAYQNDMWAKPGYLN